MDHLVDLQLPGRAPRPFPQAGQHEIQRIGLLLFDGCSLLTAGIIAEAFRLANELELHRRRRPAYQLCLLSYRGGNVACSSSIRVWTQGLDALGQRGFNAIFIACSEREPLGERDARLLSAMMEVSASVLDRCRAGRDGLRPRVSRADPPAMLAGVDAPVPGHAASAVFWCRGGVDGAPDVMPSAVDMALAQIEADLGWAVAREVSRRLVVQPEAPVPPADADEAIDADDPANAAQSESVEKVRASARWIAEHYMEAISVADAARVATMSERNYLRRFKVTLGMTPSEYLLRARLEMICRLLMETTLPVDKIARRCGMGNGDRLAKVFRKRFALSPTEYRTQNRARPGEAAPIPEET